MRDYLVLEEEVKTVKSRSDWAFRTSERREGSNYGRQDDSDKSVPYNAISILMEVG